MRWLLTVILGAPLLFASSTDAAEPAAPATAQISSTGGVGARCRTGAGTEAETIEILPEGARVEVLGVPHGEWQPIACGGGEGFVHRDHVSRPPSAARTDFIALDPGVAFGVEWSETGSVPRELAALAEEIGRMPPVVMWYQAWGAHPNWSAVQIERLEAVASYGVTPLITWEPWTPGEGAEQPAYRLDNIVRGDFDAYIDTWAAELAAFGDPVYLRFAHEMNGDWYPWSAGVNGNTNEDYVAAWRHVHDRFGAAGADNVRWVWGPNADWYEGQTPMDELYPGDDYVDWLALSGFNWGTSAYWEGCDCSSQWQSFEEIFANSYATLTALTDKPIIVAETGSAEEGGDKAAWVAQLETTLLGDFPNIRALVWFDEDKQVSWRIRSSDAAFEAFVDLAQNPYFQGTLP